MAEISYQEQLEYAGLDSDPEYDYFDKWYKENERRFHCGQFNDRQIAYSAFLEGFNYIKKGNK